MWEAVARASYIWTKQLDLQPTRFPLIIADGIIVVPVWRLRRKGKSVDSFLVWSSPVFCFLNKKVFVRWWWDGEGTSEQHPSIPSIGRFCLPWYHPPCVVSSQAKGCFMWEAVARASYIWTKQLDLQPTRFPLIIADGIIVVPVWRLRRKGKSVDSFLVWSPPVFCFLNKKVFVRWWWDGEGTSEQHPSIPSNRPWILFQHSKKHMANSTPHIRWYGNNLRGKGANIEWKPHEKQSRMPSVVKPLYLTTSCCCFSHST